MRYRWTAAISIHRTVTQEVKFLSKINILSGEISFTSPWQETISKISDDLDESLKTGKEESLNPKKKFIIPLIEDFQVLTADNLGPGIDLGKLNTPPSQSLDTSTLELDNKDPSDYEILTWSFPRKILGSIFLALGKNRRED